MGIDLGALEKEADRRSADCVVTRRWLRQVLKELRDGRAARLELDTLSARVASEAGPAALDHDAYVSVR